jgi:hypothetical protein
MDVEWWDRPLESRPGTPSRLGGILVFHEFEWLDEFPDERAQFKNGKALARLVKRDAPETKTPALLLTVRDDADELSFETDDYYIAVVNLRRIRKARGDPAVTYYAERLGPGITSATHLHTLAANPDVISTVVERELDLKHIADWVAANEDGIEQLRTIPGVTDAPATSPDLAQVLAALRALEGLDAEVVDGIKTLADGSLDRDSRLRFLDALARPLVADEEALAKFVRENRELLTTITRSDVEALDIIALAHRRAVLAEFDRLLHDDAYFASQRMKRKGPENVWQKFIEDNAWVIGFTLAPQFLHAWSMDRLEQTVKGFSIGGPGKRADAVLRTAGALSALALTEIKHHRTALLGTEYRPGSWRISGDVAGGVAQCQATADEMSRELGKAVDLKDSDGYTVDQAFVCRPRTVLIVGSLNEFIDDKGSVHHEKFESFERFRRGLRDPEILTFDELYARACLLVELADEAASS